MQDVPAQQRLRAHDGAAQQEEVGLLGDERRVPGERGPHRDRPDRQLVPREQVAGERQAERQEQQDDPDHPVELARRLVGARVEDTSHVQRDRQHHEVGSPPVEVPHQIPEEHTGADRLHVLVRDGAAQVGHGPVEEHQEDAGERQQHEEEERETTEAERVGELQAVPLHLRGVQVVQHVVHGGQRPIALRVLVALPVDGAGTEDGLPDLGLAEAVADLARRRQLDLRHVPPSPGYRLSGRVTSGCITSVQAPRSSRFVPLDHSGAACEVGTSAMVRAPPDASGSRA